MKSISIILALLGLGAGGIAAWFWYCTSVVPTVPTWARGNEPFEPVIPELSQAGWIIGLLEAASEIARLNKLAALWTGGSILFSAASAIFGAVAK